MSTERKAPGLTPGAKHVSFTWAFAGDDLLHSIVRPSRDRDADRPFRAKLRVLPGGNQLLALFGRVVPDHGIDENSFVVRFLAIENLDG
jgi:hypothetical protein